MTKINYLPTIGLEIHIELATKTKMFCKCLNDPDEKHPNMNVCPICAAHPGTLPVINKEAVRHVLKLGLALNSEIPDFSRFDRKHYFYPDLPKGYQISQYQYPLVKGGYLNIPVLNEKTNDKNSKFLIPNSKINPKFQTNSTASKTKTNLGQIQNYKKIRLTRIHLEEDTGSLEHKGNASLVDLNRAGMPLMELVTEPDLASAYEAKKFAEELQLILRYLGISEANMEKGQMRIEANVSIRPETEEKLGTKVEVKNINSFSAVFKTIKYEIKRQTEVLEKGEKVMQETRGWHDTKEITFSQRSKEEAKDYRYFPEPDLPPLKIKEFPDFNLEHLKNSIPELPQEKRARFSKEFQIKPEQIETIITDKKLADYFENTISELLAWQKASGEKIDNEKYIKLINLTANYFTSDLLGLMKERNLPITDLKITPEDFAELIKLAGEEKISSRGAKNILLEMLKTGEDPHVLAKKMNLIQTNNEKELMDTAKKIVESNPKAKDDFKSGNQNSLQFLVGQMMKETKGKANPQITREIIKKILKS